MIKHNPLGSTWSKWDLHFHTPSSFDYEDSSVTNAEIVEALLAAGVRVVAITDHHVIDIDRIAALRDLAQGRLTVLPGIELRSDLGSKPIHYIGIFPETSDLSHLWDRIKGALDLTPKGLMQKGGDEGIYVPIEEASEIFSDLGGLISIHAGSKSNSIEDISNQEQFQRRIKYDLTRRHVSILEVGQLKDVVSYKDIVFPTIGLERLLVVGSDNHNVREYEAPVACWLKADPCFLGLRQVLNEPESRSFLGHQPPDVVQTETNSSRYVQSVRFAKNSDSSLKEDWFDGIELDFSPGLVAIIGNRGNGKSALSDVLGMLGNSPHRESFSFLHKDQFLYPQDKKGAAFSATLRWRNGEETQRRLDSSFDPAGLETVQYIPQHHLEAICDELGGGQKGLFDQELKKVIFSRVSESARLGCETLDAVLDLRTRRARESADLARAELAVCNAKVLELEKQGIPTYKSRLTEQLKQAKLLLKDHKATEPKPVQKPDDEDPARQDKLAAANREIEELAEQIAKLDKGIQACNAEVKEHSRRLELTKGIRKAQDNLRKQVQNFLEGVRSDCEELGLEPASLAKLETPTSELDSIEEAAQASLKEAKFLLDTTTEDNLPKKRDRIKATLVKKREALDLPSKQYQEYLEARSVWAAKEKKLIGDDKAEGSVTYCEARLKMLDELPKQLTAARAEQLACSRKILEEQLGLLDVYRELYAPIQAFIDDHALAKDRYGLQVEVSVVASGFEERFLSMINQTRRGAFHGQHEGREHVSRILEYADFNTPAGLTKFLQGLLDELRERTPSTPDDKTSLESLAVTHVNARDVYDYLLGLEYLEPRYVLRYDNKPLERLSPGERGALLLVFFLLIDENSAPLVIDQPEGNLDNQTVFELLVDCIKEARKRRQIILVTHNPNLAVVCDADQIIYASLQKDDGSNKISYVSGALENPTIGRKVIDVLEGTKPAIDNRIAKYKIIFEADAS